MGALVSTPKIFSCIWLISLIGAKDVESACLSIVIGGTVAELGSFVLQYILFVLEKSSDVISKLSKSTEQNYKKKVWGTALPVAFSAYARSALVTIEHILIPRGLEKSGSSKDVSLAAYGTIHSMVFPLVLFPSALSGSFAGLLVPEIAEASAKGDHNRIHRIIYRVFFAALTFAIGVAGIMMCFSYELANIVYPTANAGKYILMIAPLIPVMYLDTSVDGVLKGLGEQVYCMGVNIVDALLSVILVWILLPQMGITGYILTVYFTEIVNAALSIARLFTVTKIKPRIFQWVIKPLIAIVLTCSAVKILATRITGEISGAFELTGYITLASCIYLLVVFIFDRTYRKKQP